MHTFYYELFFVLSVAKVLFQLLRYTCKLKLRLALENHVSSSFFENHSGYAYQQPPTSSQHMLSVLVKVAVMESRSQLPRPRPRPRSDLPRLRPRTRLDLL